MLRLRPTVWTPQVDEHVAHDSHGRTTQWMGHGPGTGLEHFAVSIVGPHSLPPFAGYTWIDLARRTSPSLFFPHVTVHEDHSPHCVCVQFRMQFIFEQGRFSVVDNLSLVHFLSVPPTPRERVRVS